MPFEIKETVIPGCFELIPKVHSDARGLFIKTFHSGEFGSLGLETSFSEEFYSVSRKGVLRGLHYQKPPADYIKTVTCVHGSVLDAVLDLRKDSPSFGRHAVFTLDAARPAVIYIPKGVAHGFYSLSDHAIMAYATSAVHSPEHDAGILWNSAGIPWPDPSPAISPRDAAFETFDQYRGGN